MKKYFYYFAIAGAIGFILGFFFHNKTEPKWNVIWNLKTNSEFYSKLQILSNFYQLKEYPENNLQLISSVNKEIENFVKKNENFEDIKDIRIIRIDKNEKTIRFNTNNIIKSEKDLRAFIEKLNNTVINKLKIEIEKKTVLLKEEIKNDLNLEVIKIENFLNFVEKNNLNVKEIENELEKDNENLNLENLNLIDNLSSNPKILIRNVDDIKNLLNGYKNPKTYNQLVSQNKILNDNNRIYKMLENNMKIVSINKLEKSINRQPNRLFMSFAFMTLTIVLLMLFFGLRMFFEKKGKF